MEGQNYVLVLRRVVWRQDRVICRLSDGKKKKEKEKEDKKDPDKLKKLSVLVPQKM